ncbi:hypothetical protein ERY430_40220 [Erythrobacter sp. EC-HK427]|nr:hypothetical protein ERY430_40220 [Erythrobacter sp. EC-HK427]
MWFWREVRPASQWLDAGRASAETCANKKKIRGRNVWLISREGENDRACYCLSVI